VSLLDPETAEDRMAWVPIFGCFLPLLVVIRVVLAVLP
jgi:hypothetical protein